MRESAKRRFVGVVKQVNRRVADSRHDVWESFTVEHRLHGKSLPVVWRKNWGFLSVGTDHDMRQDCHRQGQVGIMFICDPFCPSIGDGISLYLLGCRNQSL